MYQNKQLDMLLEKTTPDSISTNTNKIYIRYYLGKTIGRQNIQEMIDDLYNIEEVLSKNDVLFIVIKNNINDTIRSVLTHIWETEGIYVIVQSIKNLQFNILQHELVPPHRLMNEQEVKTIKTRFNIMSDDQFPEISRFDPVAQAIFMKPGQVCEIIRPSKTTINSYYYRICV
jgi:DNA-directed RNA polymerase subunit H (RpoH/RPB5)